MAAALHVADALEAGVPWARPIPEGVVARAVRLCRDYLLPHAVAAFDLMGADATLAGARRVWGWVARTRRSEFTKRDCFNALRARFDTVDELRPSLDLLERHYLIRPRRTPERQSPGRSPSPTYDVNPLARSDDESPQPPGGDPENPPTPGPDLNSADCAYFARGVTGRIELAAGEGQVGGDGRPFDGPTGDSSNEAVGESADTQNAHNPQHSWSPGVTANSAY